MDSATIPSSIISGIVPADKVGASTVSVQYDQFGDGPTTIIPNYSGMLYWFVQGKMNHGSTVDVDYTPSISGTFSNAKLYGIHAYGSNQTNWSFDAMATVVKGQSVTFGHVRSNGASQASITTKWHIIPNVVGA